MTTERATSRQEGRKAGIKAYTSIAVVVVLAVAAWWFEPDWLYGWLKVLHIVAVISWMVGCFICRVCSSITPMPRLRVSLPQPSW